MPVLSIAGLHRFIRAQIAGKEAEPAKAARATHALRRSP